MKKLLLILLLASYGCGFYRPINQDKFYHSKEFIFKRGDTVICTYNDIVYVILDTVYHSDEAPLKQRGNFYFVKWFNPYNYTEIWPYPVAESKLIDMRKYFNGK